MCRNTSVHELYTKGDIGAEMNAMYLHTIVWTPQKHKYKITLSIDKNYTTP